MQEGKESNIKNKRKDKIINFNEYVCMKGCILVWKNLLYGIEIYYIIRHILYEGSYVRKGYVYEWLGEICVYYIKLIWL